MDRFVTLLKAVSDRNRLRVVAALLEYDELCACQITELLQVAGATASRHMGVLTSSGVVVSRKKGRWVHYRLHKDNPEVTSLLTCISQKVAKDPTVLEDLDTLKHILSRGPRDEVPPPVGSCCERV